MSTRLILLVHAATRLMRDGGFPAPDASLDAGGAAKAAAYRWAGPRPDRIFCGRSEAARQTVDALGLQAIPDPALDDADHGAWSGCTFDAIHADAPDAFAAWLQDPSTGAPGGESLAAVRARVSPFLDRATTESGVVLAVTSPTVARAALAHALDLPLPASLRIDLGPLGTIALSYNRVWRLQSLTA